jgi:hypothetical protein
MDQGQTIQELILAEIEAESCGAIELAGFSSDLLWAQDTFISSSNSNKCPPPPKSGKRSSNPAVRCDLLALAKMAESVNLSDLARKLRVCCTDFIILTNPDHTLCATPLRCNHKLCPLCHAYHSQKLRSRLTTIMKRAHVFITLTMATYHDHDFVKNLRILKRAYRLMTQRKKKKQWVPFESGYFWRLEVTDGKGFHPHLHVLSTHNWIDYDRLRQRWRQCIDTAGGKGDLIWISEVKPNTINEVTKYLSKDIDLIETNRWPELCQGLFNQRTYGSGRALALPPLETRDKRFLCFGEDITNEYNSEYVEFFQKSHPETMLRPDSGLYYRLTTKKAFENFYGYEYVAPLIEEKK